MNHNLIKEPINLINEVFEINNKLLNESLINTIDENENLIKTKNYSSNLKKKIANRVENLKSKKHFKEIFKIIHSINSSKSYTKDSSGVYINFNTLDNNTLKAIEEYLNIINPKSESIPLPTKYTPYFFDDYIPKDSGIKLSNHEKNILKYMNIATHSEQKSIKNTESETKLLNDSDTKTSETNNKVNIIIKPFSYE